MTDELFGELDTRGWESDLGRLKRSVSIDAYRERYDDPLEGLLDDEATQEEMNSLLREEWGALNSQVWLIAPNESHGGAEVRRWKEYWWLGRRGDDYWVGDPDDILNEELVRIELSEANKAIWHSVNTEVFAVVQDVDGPRMDAEPQFVRHWQADEWLSLWYGVCEVWAATSIDDYELVPAAEWGETRPGIRHTRVQTRISARLRERGLDSTVARLVWRHGGPSNREDQSMLQIIWNSIRGQVYVWVRSCLIDDASPRVRFWRDDCWIKCDSFGTYTTMTDAELIDWGCLVRVEDWERSQRTRRAEQDLDWREVGF